MFREMFLTPTVLRSSEFLSWTVSFFPFSSCLYMTHVRYTILSKLTCTLLCHRDVRSVKRILVWQSRPWVLAKTGWRFGAGPVLRRRKKSGHEKSTKVDTPFTSICYIYSLVKPCFIWSWGKKVSLTISKISGYSLKLKKRILLRGDIFMYMFLIFQNGKR